MAQLPKRKRKAVRQKLIDSQGPLLTKAAISFFKEKSRLSHVSGGVLALGYAHLGPLGKSSPNHEVLKGSDTAAAKAERKKMNKAIRLYLQGTFQLNRFQQFMWEVSIIRTCENFLTYVSELLSLIYKSKPDMLKSEEQVGIEFVLKHQSMDELRDALAERKVDALSSKGLRDLDKVLDKQMGFKLFRDEATRDSAALVVEYRNLFVHKRGVVDAVSARRFPSLAAQVGKRLDVEAMTSAIMCSTLENAVYDIDARAAAKFSLELERKPSLRKLTPADRLLYPLPRRFVESLE